MSPCSTVHACPFKIRVWKVNLPARLDLEVLSLRLPVDGGDGPGDADAEEDVDGVGARHVAHRVVRAVVADGRHLGGEGVCAKGERDREGYGMPASLRHVRALGINGIVCGLISISIILCECHKLLSELPDSTSTC